MKIKSIFKIIAIFLILIILFPYTITLAADITTVTNAIGTFALNYYNSVQSGGAPEVTWYSVSLGNKASYGKRGIPSSGTPTLQSDGTYHLDCVGFVNFCVYNATGISEGQVVAGNGGYVVPYTCNDPFNRANFDLTPISSSSELQTGDIIVESGHVSIFVREGTSEYIIESIYGIGPKKNDYASNTESGAYKARVKQTVAGPITASTLNVDPALTSTLGMSNVNQSEFYYNGVPNGQYSVSAGLLEWIVDALKDIFIYLINIIFYILRMIPVGFTAIVENLITYIIKTITGVEANMWDDSTRTSSEGDITIESIIFGSEIDDVNVFDVNFFKVQNTTP